MKLISPIGIGCLIVLTLILISNFEFVTEQSLLFAADLQEEEFISNYDDYYKELANFDLEILKSELDDTIEDAIISGHHFTRAALKPKVGRFKKDLFNILNQRYCQRNTEASGNNLRDLTGRCLIELSDAQTLNIQPSDAGRIASIVVRIIEKIPKREFCNSSDFENL